tara:strand:- start:1432 stop:3507 length:2076 start_codon:yes stop_codon:yes gene_type:complete
MNYIPHTVTAISKTTGLNDSIIVQGAAVSITNTDGAVLMYDDAAGTNPESVKYTGTSGQVVIYVTEDTYTLTVSGSDSIITVIEAIPRPTVLSVDDPSDDIGPTLHAAMLAGGTYMLAGECTISTWPGRVSITNPFKLVGFENAKINITVGGTLARVASSNILFERLEIICTDDSLNFIDYNNLPSDTYNVWFEKITATGCNHFAFCNDTPSTAFYLIDSGFNSCRFKNVNLSGIRLTGLRMLNVVADDCHIDGSKRDGIKLGFVKNDGTQILHSEILGVVIRRCTAKNINPTSDPGSAGSYCFYASGEDAHIYDVYCENHHAANLTSTWSNMEPIYIKSKRARLHDFVVKNCSNNQGGFAVKGLNVTDSTNGDNCSVYNGTVVNDSQTGCFSASRAGWIQGEKCRIHGMTIKGMRSRNITIKSLDERKSKWIKAYNNDFEAVAGDKIYQLNGSFEYVEVGNGDTVVGVTRTQDLDFCTIGTTNVIDKLVISHPYFEDTMPSSLIFRVFSIKDSATITHLVLDHVSPPFGRCLVELESPVDVGTLDMSRCDVRGLGRAFYRTTAAFRNVTTHLNAGFLTREGPTQYLALQIQAAKTFDVELTGNTYDTTVKLNTVIESSDIIISGTKEGDIVHHTLVMPDDVTILSSYVKSASTIKMQIQNDSSTSGTVGLTSIVGEVFVEKINGVINNNI